MELLPTAEFVVNSWLNSATGHTPFELLYSYTPDFTIPAGRPTGVPLVDKHLQHLCTLRIDAEAALRMSKEHMKEGHPKVLWNICIHRWRQGLALSKADQDSPTICKARTQATRPI